MAVDPQLRPKEERLRNEKETTKEINKSTTTAKIASKVVKPKPQVKSKFGMNTHIMNGKASQTRNESVKKIATKTTVMGTAYRNGKPMGRTPITAPSGSQPKTTAAPKYQLLDSEKEKYGDRCPTGFKKIDLLGKGGIALVWLAETKDAKR